MFETVPIELPETSTRSPLTIWLAFWKTALTVYVEPLESTMIPTATTATTTAAMAAIRTITLVVRIGRTWSRGSFSSASQ